MKTLLIDFHIHTAYSQEVCAHLSIKDTLDYYQKLGERAEKRVIFRINDHDNFYGGVKAVEYYLEHRDEYPNIFVVPGIEFNVNLGPALKFKKPDAQTNNTDLDPEDKFDYIFKKAHVGAAPILKDKESFEKWKNNKDMQVYSKLAKLCLDRAENERYHFDSMSVPLSHFERTQLSNTGDQIIASKNLIRKKFGVIIPYAYLEPCVKEGLTHTEIVDTFLKLATEYLSKHYAPYKNVQPDSIRKHLLDYLRAEKCIDLSYIMPTNEALGKAFIAIEKEYDVVLPKECLNNCIYSNLIRDKKISEFYHNVTDAVLARSIKCKGYKRERVYYAIKQLSSKYFTEENPNEFYTFGGLRRIYFDEMCKMVYEAGGLIDVEHPDKGFEIHQNKKIPYQILRSLDYSVLKTSDRDMIAQKLAQKQDLALEELLGKDCKNDMTGLVRVQLLRYGMKQNGIKINNDMMGTELTRFSMKNTRFLNNVLKVMENNRILVSYGTDKHFNVIDYYMFAAKDKEYRKDYNGKMRIIDENYLKNLLQSIKQEKELRYELENYAIPTQTTNTICIFNYTTKQVEKYKAYSSLVKQTAFCDAVFGKEIDFAKSNMFSMQSGALVKEEIPQLSKEDAEFNDIMRVIYADLHQTLAKMGEENITKEQFSEIKEYSRMAVLKYKKETTKIDERKNAEFLGKMITRNRTKMKEYFDSNVLSK